MAAESDEQSVPVQDHPPLSSTARPMKETPAKEDVKEVCRDMFDKIASYVNGELTCEHSPS